MQLHAGLVHVRHGERCCSPGHKTAACWQELLLVCAYSLHYQDKPIQDYGEKTQTPREMPQHQT